ncbi:MAG: NAD(P)H-dependent oxidoreductase [Candidatus Odinarchaeota archaeon]
MKILAIIGSKRKRNTVNSVRLLENSLLSHTDCSVEYLFLKDYDLPFCSGCHQCLRKSEEKCQAYEVVNSLRMRMDTADGLIFATPVYLQHISAMMKNFFDHFAYLEHRPRYFDKPAIIVATSAGSGLKQTTSYLKKFTRAWGFHVIGEIKVKMIAYESSKYQKKVAKQVSILSRKMTDEITRKGLRSPDNSEIVDFRVRRLITLATRDSFPRDYEYWENRNWFNKSYYTNARLGIFGSLMGYFSEIIAKIIMKVVYKI